MCDLQYWLNDNMYGYIIHVHIHIIQLARPYRYHHTGHIHFAFTFILCISHEILVSASPSMWSIRSKPRLIDSSYIAVASLRPMLCPSFEFGHQGCSSSNLSHMRLARFHPVKMTFMWILIQYMCLPRQSDTKWHMSSSFWTITLMWFLLHNFCIFSDLTGTPTS